jgi:hypothetical protein
VGPVIGEVDNRECWPARALPGNLSVADGWCRRNDDQGLVALGFWSR